MAPIYTPVSAIVAGKIKLKLKVRVIHLWAVPEYTRPVEENFIHMLLLDEKGDVRVMARDLTRTRHQIEMFYKLKSQLQGVALRIQELAKLIGIPVLKAKGEAEALCAQLNSEGHVDACITPDSDAFLFGEKCIIKYFSPNSKEVKKIKKIP